MYAYNFNLRVDENVHNLVYIDDIKRLDDIIVNGWYTTSYDFYIRNTKTFHVVFYFRKHVQAYTSVYEYWY